MTSLFSFYQTPDTDRMLDVLISNIPYISNLCYGALKNPTFLKFLCFSLIIGIPALLAFGIMFGIYALIEYTTLALTGNLSMLSFQSVIDGYLLILAQTLAVFIPIVLGMIGIFYVKLRIKKLLEI